MKDLLQHRENPNYKGNATMMQSVPKKSLIHKLNKRIMVGVLSATTVLVQTPVAFANEDDEIRGTTAAGGYLAAQAADTAFDHDLAAQLLEDALIYEPDEAILQRSLMDAYVQSGRFDEAVELAEPLQRDEASGRLARNVLFVADMRAKRFNAALGTMNVEKATQEMAVELILDRLLSAWALVGQGKMDEAVELATLEAEYSWYPLFSNFHAGLILEIAGKRDEAKSRYAATIEFPRAVATAPDTVLRAIEALTKVHIIDGEMEDAERVLNAGLDILVNHPPFIALQADFENQSTNPMIRTVQEGAAEVYFDLGKAIDRDSGEPYVNQLYQLGHAVAPDHEPLLMAMGGLLGQVERYTAANEAYQALPENSVFKTRAEIQMALNLDAMKEIDASVGIMQGVLEREPNNDTANLALAGTLMRADRYEEAAKILDGRIDRVKTAERSHWLLFYRRGMARDKLKRWPEAEADFLKALDLFPNQPEVLNYLGYTWVDMGINLDKGLGMLNKAVELRPNTGFIVDSLGWAHYRLKNFDLAAQHLEEAVLLTPTDPTIIDHLGDAYWQVDRKLEARYKWGQALESKPDDELKVKIEAKLKDGLSVNLLKKAELEKNDGSTETSTK